MAEVNQQNPGARKSSGPRQKKKSTKVDMTAMVDVAFLLLTFFILTTTLASPKVMELIKPPLDEGVIIEKPVQCSKIMEIYLGEAGNVHWYAGCDRETISTTDLSDEGIRAEINAQLAANPELIITIKPMVTSNYSSLVDILDEMKITGATRYALSSVQPIDEELLSSKELK